MSAAARRRWGRGTGQRRPGWGCASGSPPGRTGPGSRERGSGGRRKWGRGGGGHTRFCRSPGGREEPLRARSFAVPGRAKSSRHASLLPATRRAPRRSARLRALPYAGSQPLLPAAPRLPGSPDASSTRRYPDSPAPSATFGTLRRTPLEKAYAGSEGLGTRCRPSGQVHCGGGPLTLGLTPQPPVPGSGMGRAAVQPSSALGGVGAGTGRGGGWTPAGSQLLRGAKRGAARPAWRGWRSEAETVGPEGKRLPLSQCLLAQTRATSLPDRALCSFSSAPLPPCART